MCTGDFRSHPHSITFSNPGNHSGIKGVVAQMRLGDKPAPLFGPRLLQLASEVEDLAEVIEVFCRKILVTGVANKKFWDKVYQDHKDIFEMWLWCSKTGMERQDMEILYSGPAFGLEGAREPLLIRRIREVPPSPLNPQVIVNEITLVHLGPQEILRCVVESDDGGVFLFRGLSGESAFCQSFLDCVFEASLIVSRSASFTLMIPRFRPY